MEEKFKTTDEVKTWLVEDRSVPAPVAAAVASTLFEGGYVYPSMLLNIRQEDLLLLTLSPPQRIMLFNKLQHQQQPHPQRSTEDKAVETPSNQNLASGLAASKNSPPKGLGTVPYTGVHIFANVSRLFWDGQPLWILRRKK